MQLDLSDAEAAALLRELDHIIENDRYFLSPRIRTLTAIRAKIRPELGRKPLPEPKRYAPPRAGRPKRNRLTLVSPGEGRNRPPAPRR